MEKNVKAVIAGQYRNNGRAGGSRIAALAAVVVTLMVDKAVAGVPLA
jgi:hypothetical protein